MKTIICYLLSVSAFLRALLVHFFRSFTLSLYFHHIALIPCCALFMVCYFQCIFCFIFHYSLCCTIFMLYLFNTALFSCYTIFILHFSHVALISYCSFSILHYFHATFVCSTLFMLHFLRVALFILHCHR